MYKNLLEYYRKKQLSHILFEPKQRHFMKTKIEIYKGNVHSIF
jgi:hypothetical protein